MTQLAPLPPSVRRGGFHRLRVAAIEVVAEDAVAVSFTLPESLRDRFTYRAGQHLTLRTWLQGQELRRTYSICVPPGSPELRIGVRRIAGGLLSRHIHDSLRAGDELDVMEPAGRFTPPFDPSATHSYVAIAAGSGITPVLALLGAGLATEPKSQATLLYGNRSVESTMFLDEISDLKDRYPARFQLVHVFSRQPQPLELHSGRLDRAKVERLSSLFFDPSTIDAWMLCGPHAMVAEVRQFLAAERVPEARIYSELFYVEDQPPLRSQEERQALARAGNVTVRARLDGRETEFAMTRSQTIVDALSAVRPDAPYSCKGGVCATCRARLTEGRVAMDHTYALEADEREAGYILTCQSHPLSDTLTVDYDA